MGSLGLDLGSVFVALAVVDEEGRLVLSSYSRHEGDIPGAVEHALRRLDGLPVRTAGVTGSGTDGIDGLPRAFDPVVAIVEGTRRLLPGARNILYIGAGSYHLIRLSPGGEYLRHTSNSACASGTGSFLDQQAYRLNFRPEDLADHAARCRACPSVATRCSVFAKTDMIHLQQDGHPPEDIAAGLCRGLSRSTVDALLRGQQVVGPTAVVGGVARNRAVIAGIEEQLGFPVEVPARPELTAAIGAALAGRKAGVRFEPSRRRVTTRTSRSDEMPLRPPLALRLSRYPEFEPAVAYVDGNDTEVALLRPAHHGETVPVALGIDIGSTSTKCTLVDPDRQVVALAYRKTAGDPIRAAQLLFQGILDLSEKQGIHFEIIGAGTTGSGRKLIRRVIGAEHERDEITAHARAATFLDPEVDTILEIGGQDAKFTQLSRGVVYNSVMNYVCAAGTGSFIEEQARKIGITVSGYADFVMGARAPMTSDRCTVFMERDLDLLLASGWSRREVAAAVLYSVRDNYLNKVVNGLHIGERVYFQGATARNRALIAAFEQELDRPILVSPFCHVTGALGMSLTVLEAGAAEHTFRGLSFASAPVHTETEECALCANDCTLTVIRTEQEVVAWGAKCGREYSELKRRREEVPGYAVLRERERLLFSLGRTRAASDPPPRARVGLPRSLTTFAYLPFWRALVEGLGCELVLSDPSGKEMIEEGTRHATAEFCAPVVLAHGHLANLARKAPDLVLLPQMIRERKPDRVTDAHFCPYVQSHAAVIRSLPGLGLAPESLLTPTIMLNRGERWLAEAIYSTLGRRIGASRPEVRAATCAALAADREFRERLHRLGEEEIGRLSRDGEIGVVLVGRPYNALDPGMNLDLPRKIAEKGLSVLPLDALPVGPEDLSDDWRNMYWAYGQRILAAAEYVASRDSLFAIFLTSFACGPDSYLLSYVKEIMGRAGKPFLVLQLDAHGADAGYLTRVEAAIESFRAWTPRRKAVPLRRAPGGLTRERKVLIPPLDPIGARLFAANFRAFGFDAEAIPETPETLALGLKHTLGGECVPCPTTTGAFLAAMEREGLPPERVAFFMPTACGPCRFGQYATLDRLILERQGRGDVLVLSPSSVNAYQGLPDELRRMVFDCILLTDILHKVEMHARPYERTPGAVDCELERAVQSLEKEMERGGAGLPAVLRDALPRIFALRTPRPARPRVGVVGEIYVRSDPFINQDLVRTIERLGGEVVLASLAEWVLYTDFLKRHGIGPDRPSLAERIAAPIRERFLSAKEQLYYRIAEPFLGGRQEPAVERVLEAGHPYVPLEFQGEAILTIGRAVLMAREEGCEMIVSASPTFCMPGTITSAIFPQVERDLGVPVLALSYDGSGDTNRVLVPHLHYLVERAARRQAELHAESAPRGV